MTNRLSPILRLLLVQGFPLLVACTPSVTLSPDAKLSCEAPTDCPPEWTCRTSTHTCARLVDGPALAAPATFSGHLVRAGAHLVVGFTVDGALGEPPEVAVQLGAAAKPFTLDEAKSDKASNAFTFTYDVAGTEPETVEARVTVRLVDPLGNAADLLLGTVTFDFTAPAAPDAKRIRLVESSVNPGDPAVAHTLAATGLAGACTGAASVRLSSPPDAGAPVLDGEGGFPALTVSWTEERAVVVACVDAAGNESPQTRVALPRVTAAVLRDVGTQQPVKVVRPAQTVTLAWTFTVPGGAVTPEVFYAAPEDLSRPRTIGGSVQPGSGGAPSTFIGNVSGLSRSGLDALRIWARIPGDPASTAPGSVAISNVFSWDVDGTPPTIDAAKLEFVFDDAGAAVKGNAGAVRDSAGSDVIAPLDGVSIVFTPGDPLVAATPVAGDGSFAAIRTAGLTQIARLQITDAAGNVSEPVAVAGLDLVAPVISSVIAPPWAKPGAAFEVRFNVADSSDLAADPVVRLGAVGGTRITGTRTTSDGASHAFTYSVAPSPQDSGPRELSVTARDVFGNETTETARIIVDGDPPVSTLLSPVGDWGGSDLHGCSTDALGRAIGAVSIEALSTGHFFDGGAFSPVPEVFHFATGDGTCWSLQAPAKSLLVDGASYRIRSFAKDPLDNVESPPKSVTVIYRASAVDAPIDVTVRSRGERGLNVAFTVPRGGDVDAIRLYYGPAGATGSPAGTGAAHGNSPVTLALDARSALLTSVPAGQVRLCVTTLRGNAESPCRTVIGESRAWREGTSLPTGATADVVGGAIVGDSLLVSSRGFPQRGTLWRSPDAGATWSSVREVSSGIFLPITEADGVLFASVNGANPPSPPLVRSVDGGATWAAPSMDFATPGQPVVAITSFAVSGGTFLAAMTDGVSQRLATSIDRGATWQALPVQTTGITLQSLALGAGAFLRVRESLSSGHVVERSVDGGHTWTSARLTPAASLTNVIFSSAQGRDGAYVGDGENVWASYSGGATWGPVPGTPFAGIGSLGLLGRTAGLVVGLAPNSLVVEGTNGPWSARRPWPFDAGAVVPISIDADAITWLETKPAAAICRSFDAGLTRTCDATLPASAVFQPFAPAVFEKDGRILLVTRNAKTFVFGP